MLSSTATALFVALVLLPLSAIATGTCMCPCPCPTTSSTTSSTSSTSVKPTTTTSPQTTTTSPQATTSSTSSTTSPKQTTTTTSPPATTSSTTTTGGPVHPICVEEIANAPHFTCPALTAFSFSDFQVYAFGTLTGSGGDIMLRAFSCGNVNFGPNGFTVGNGIISTSLIYSLVVGGTLQWTQGTLLPASAKALVAGSTSNTAPELSARVVGCTGGGNQCIVDCCNQARNYFLGVSNQFASAATNVVATLRFGNVLYLNASSSTATRYYVSVPAITFNQVRSYVLVNFNPNAQVIITITGGDVTFNGGGFPTSNPGSIVYNIPGTHDVIVNTGVQGSILSPESNISNPNGVIVGWVIGKNVQILQTNIPPCF